jgi:hypothetical protein
MVSLPEWNPNQWLIYLGKVHIYIGFETLRMKCTRYGICSQAAFKNARAKFFCFRAGRAYVFGRVWKNSGRGQKFRARAAPARIWHPPYARRGGHIVCRSVEVCTKNILYRFMEGQTHFLACQEVLKWVWPFMNRYRMFYLQTSTLPPRMHHKLTKHGRLCKQNNQLPTKTHVELKDNSIMYTLMLEHTMFQQASIYVFTYETMCLICTHNSYISKAKHIFKNWIFLYTYLFY